MTMKIEVELTEMNRLLTTHQVGPVDDRYPDGVVRLTLDGVVLCRAAVMAAFLRARGTATGTDQGNETLSPWAMDRTPARKRRSSEAQGTIFESTAAKLRVNSCSDDRSTLWLRRQEKP